MVLNLVKLTGQVLFCLILSAYQNVATQLKELKIIIRKLTNLELGKLEILNSRFTFSADPIYGQSAAFFFATVSRDITPNP